jgi:replicative DNA helicase
MAGFDDFLFPPSKAVQHALLEFKRIQAGGRAIEWGVPSIDEYLIPMIPGNVVSLLARPGHSKTSMMLCLARKTSSVLKDPNDIVVYATWETLVEEVVGLITAGKSGQSLEDIARGRADLKRIEQAAVASIANRIYIVGRSQFVSLPAGSTFNLDTLIGILSLLRRNGKRIALLCIDYLQKLPPPSGMGVDMTMGAIANMDRIKNLCLEFGFPGVIGIQSRRDVDEYSGIKLPRLNDAQWSSVVEQASDKVIGLTMPVKYMDHGSTVEDKVTSRTYMVSDNLLIMKVLKQRWGKSGRIFFLDYDFVGMSIDKAKEGEFLAEGEDVPFI